MGREHASDSRHTREVGREEGTRCPDCGYEVVEGYCCDKGRARRSAMNSAVAAHCRKLRRILYDLRNESTDDTQEGRIWRMALLEADTLMFGGWDNPANAPTERS